MKAKYVGHPDNGEVNPKTVGFAGKTFPRGHFVDVSKLDAKLQAKLAENPGFETSDEPLTDKEQEAADAAVAGAEVDAATSQGDVSGLTKKQVLEKLAELKEAHPDVEMAFTEKMSLAQLRGVLEGALFEIGDDE